MTDDTAPRRPSAPLTIAIDVVLVLVFCVIGRLSHAEGIFSDVPGLLNTIWPFLVAVLAVHAVMLLRGIRAERMLPGLTVWVVTVVVGLALRALSGQGVAVAFMIVATVTLALFLIGWRAILRLVRRS